MKHYEKPDIQVEAVAFEDVIASSLIVSMGEDYLYDDEEE